MASYEDSVILKFDSPDTGNANVGEKIAVKQSDVLSSIFLDEALTIPKANPFSTDQDGFYQFFCADGVYEIEIGSPVTRSLERSIGETGKLATGVTLLANTDLGDTWLDRDDHLELVVDFPDLAGSPGYPIVIGDITGYVLQSNFNSGLSYSYNTPSTYMKKNNTIDSKGTVYICSDINGGSFVYSEDGWQTESFASTSNTLRLKDIAINEKLGIIVCCGISGRIEIFDRDAKISIGNSSTVNTELNYIEYDEETLLYTAIGQIGAVYYTANPFGGWTTDTPLNIPTFGIANYIEKTKDGYLILNTSNSEIYFSATLLGNPSIIDLTPQFSGNISGQTQVKQCSDMESGKVLLIDKPSGTLYRSLDGGQNWLPVSSVGISLLNIDDMKHIKGDTWACADSVANDIFYTIDAGDSWTAVGMTGLLDIRQILINESYNIILNDDNSSTRTLATPTGAGSDQFRVSNLDSPNSTDYYQVKAK